MLITYIVEQCVTMNTDTTIECKNNVKDLGRFGCQSDFDSLLCWPFTQPGELAVLPCFSQLNGIQYDTTQNATRLCLENGTWEEYSDYTNCREFSFKEEHHHAIELTTSIYVFGYTISLLALGIAVYIFYRYKDLRCLRNNIHMNLMLSYILVDFVWIFTFILQVFLLTNSAICIILLILLHYFHLTNFFWMFIEGLYLYILVVKTFKGSRFKLPLCLFIGWGLPSIIIVLWGLFKGIALYNEDPEFLLHIHVCPWKSHTFDWIYQIPTIFVLFINAIFLIVIMWVLVMKLRSANNNNNAETLQYRKAAKALLVLIPLLGITYIFVLVGPTEGVTKNIYECLRAVLISTQGFTVALFYCFLNTEVKNTVLHHVNTWQTHRSIGSQRNRNSSRDWTQKSRDSIRLYQMFKKRESSCSVRTTTSIVVTTSLRSNTPKVQQKE